MPKLKRLEFVLGFVTDAEVDPSALSEILAGEVRHRDGRLRWRTRELFPSPGFYLFARAGRFADGLVIPSARL